MEELEKSQEIIDLENQVAEYKDKYIRLLADFDNYKKHQAKRESDLLKYKYESLFKELLPILDTIEYMSTDKENRESCFELLISQFNSILKNHDVNRIYPKYEDFDYNEAEAISIDNNPEYKNNIVTEVWKTGYSYKDKIIRYAQVKVNKIEE